MSESTQIARTGSPVTVESLSRELHRLGLKAGDIVLVHTSLSALGWVNGGPVAVIQALLRAVGDEGTLVMPTHSSQMTDPQEWTSPPVPKSWIQTIRDTMPAYDPRFTPTREMGQVAEVFRSYPGVIRSAHPSASFTALGPCAAEIMRNHQLEDPLGPGSPLGALFTLGSKSLLIGVDFDKCTALHYAEHLVWPDRPKVKQGAPLMINGQRQWIEFETPELKDSDTFIPVGATGLESGIVTTGTLGEGQAKLVDMRALVEIAVQFWSQHESDQPLT